jgi:GTP-binding protein
MADHAPGGGGLSEAGDAAALCPDVFPPQPLDADTVEEGRRLFARECRFVAGAADPASLPPDTLPEIAFAGRSNVGKSSLVNALTGRTMLARTSRTPGRTRQVNFFDLAGRLMLVDLPGYGYAEAPRASIEGWTRLSRLYLKGRAGLRRACLLIDCRHGVKDADRPLMRLLDEAGVSYQIVLTKTDKLGPTALSAALARLSAELATHGAAHPLIHLTSAETGRGIAALRAALATLAEENNQPQTNADKHR